MNNVTKLPSSRKPSRNSHGSAASRRCRRKPSSTVAGRSGVGRKCREGGTLRQKTNAATSASPPSVPNAARQETKSTITPTTKRPSIPPIALPAMYSPIAKPSTRGAISSLR